MTITIYSKPNCVFCEKAKSMVKNLGFEYEEKMFGKDFKTPDELYEAVGKQVRTMPQITRLLFHSLYQTYFLRTQSLGSSPLIFPFRIIHIFAFLFISPIT